MLPQLTREAAMTTLRARDLLNAEVAKVPPETPVAAIARMFADRGLSAVAVTDTGGTLLGIVTESDLIRRLADEDERPSGWLARLFDSPGAKAERYARSHGVNAGEVIHRRVVTAGPDDSAAHLARLMEEHKVRRVLVTEGGRVLGLVSRSNLVRAMVAQQQAPEGDLSDDRIYRAVLDAMRIEPWADPSAPPCMYGMGRWISTASAVRRRSVAPLRAGRERAGREARGGPHQPTDCTGAELIRFPAGLPYPLSGCRVSGPWRWPPTRLAG